MDEIHQDEEDILTLRYTLLQCRTELFRASKTLLEIEFAYSKVELREDFEALKIAYENVKNETDLFRTDLDGLIENCKWLIDQTTEILAERDAYYSEWQYAREILTPRPDWDKCVDLVPNWKNLSIGKSSEELVNVLSNEIAKENQEQYLAMSNSEFIDQNRFFEQVCIGTASEKNRHMRRRMTGLLIKEIWSTKSERKLSDYVFDYLAKRFDSREIAVEMSYNMRDACHRYRHHYEIDLFWKILTGQMEENVYHDQMREFARILQYFIRCCSNSSTHSLLWTIQWSDLIGALRELYPHWIDERISRVIRAAERELRQSSIETNEVEFFFLFMEDDEGRVGEFLRSIRAELQIDKDEYIEKIRNRLIGHPLISIKQFKQVIQLVDPLISKGELRRYVKWVFGPKKIFFMNDNDQLPMKLKQQVQMRDFEEIIHRLEHCSCFLH